MTHEREITEPADLCVGHRLSPTARGWSRQPLLRANLRRAWGRKKRWDYWCVITPEVIASLVYADIDYAGLASCWVLDRRSHRHTDATVLRPLARGFSMPEQVCTGTVSIDDRRLALRIEELDDVTLLRADSPGGPADRRGSAESVCWTLPNGYGGNQRNEKERSDLSADSPGITIDVSVAKPAGHESLNVVIPWSDRRFQFTSKQNTRPAAGTITAGDRTWTVGTTEDFAVQDLGRGIWPYANRWNWAAASGRSTDGRLVGLQFGGKWTDGTGATENALCIDGRLTKIGEELDWDYSWDDPLRPWRVRGERVDVVLTPEYDRYDNTDLGIVKMEVHQCFGTWTGTIRGEDGTTLSIDGIDGFAEEARNRW